MIPGIPCRVIWQIDTNISEKCIASFFRIIFIYSECRSYSHVRNVCSYPSNCTSPYSIDCCSNLKPHTYRTRLQEPVLCACLWFYTNWLSAKMAVYRHFNIQKLYFLSTQCIYVFCVNLRTNSDYFPIQHQLTGSYNRDLTLYSPVVPICTASLTFSNSAFCPQSVFMCFVWI